MINSIKNSDIETVLDKYPALFKWNKPKFFMFYVEI